MICDPTAAIKEKLEKLDYLATESQRLTEEINEDMAKLLLAQQEFMDGINKGVNNG